MAAGVMLDTSFLITLAGRERNHFDAARRYWQHFVENRMPIFSRRSWFRNSASSRSCRRICCERASFAHSTGMTRSEAAKLWPQLRGDSGERGALKGDIKIIAQAAVIEAEFAITDDSDSFYRYCRRLKESGEVQFTAIKLEDGFDRAFFANGQRDFDDRLMETPEDEEPA